MSTGSTASVPLALALLLACSGERWVIGDSEDAGPDAAVSLDAGVGPSCPVSAAAVIPALSPTPALAEQHLGRWRATLRGGEVGAFPADAVLLQLERASATLRFENGSAPPVLSPAAGHLCTSSVESCASEAGFVAGFDYRLAELRARGSILSFGLFLDEPWHEWCRQQTPVENLRPGCEPSYDVERSYDEARLVDGCAVRRGEVWTVMACDRLATVERQVCTCTADGCGARARLQQVSLRLVAPGRLEGALWFSAERAQRMFFLLEPSGE